jgi:hypothetical protein
MTSATAKTDQTIAWADTAYAALASLFLLPESPPEAGVDGAVVPDDGVELDDDSEAGALRESVT